MANKHSYDDDDKSAIYRVMAERRDMRHFNNDPIDDATFRRILGAAHMAPSVGLMQPWRFIRIQNTALRQALHAIVEHERVLTAQALGQRGDEFLKLKVEGILQCAEVLVVALPDGREQHVFGRRTLPEMDMASVSCAIQNMWLASRAEGIGLGWVSLFDPNAVMALLDMPESSQPMAILCIGQVDAFYEKPKLVLDGWTQEKPLSDFMYTNVWKGSASAIPEGER